MLNVRIPMAASSLQSEPATSYLLGQDTRSCDEHPSLRFDEGIGLFAEFVANQIANLIVN